ncbi:class E basic helix-loop-helix protein 41-like [Arapaima gigas]
MEERIARLQESQMLEHADFLGVEFPSLYMCKSKRGMKREDSKEAYKLPHRLIEKKRRDRINECIGQLKELLPEHLKLTASPPHEPQTGFSPTLGHLEKAVVLELTLKHLTALTAVTEQQHRRIVALQSGQLRNGEQAVRATAPSDVDAFHSGFQTCAREVLQYLSRCENWTSREHRSAQLVEHLSGVCARLVPRPHAKCVPVIQRTHAGELAETDTDTDSGYGGEPERAERECCPRATAAPRVKLELGDEPPSKKLREEPAAVKAEPGGRPDMALLNTLVGLGGVPFGQHAPLCVPFYVLNPAAAAAAAAPYVPVLDKAALEKHLFPGSAFPLFYPGFPALLPGLSAALKAEQSGSEPRSPAPGALVSVPEGAHSPDPGPPLEVKSEP